MPRPLRLMISSTVYGIEPLLGQVFAALRGYGYEVWMSHKGTVPINPHKTAFGNCLEAVDRCDAFLGIITGRYGSGVGTNQKSITHREIIRAINRKKLRWFLVHHDVAVARQLLKQFRFNPDGSPTTLAFRPTTVLDDLRALDVYERATRASLPLAKRVGNWVQEFSTDVEVLDFIKAQLSDPDRVRQLIRGNRRDH